MAVAADIFISYRRSEASYLAGWLHDRLAARFGDDRVFLDIDWIKAGVDFMEAIDQAIGRSGVLLLIIGPRWLAPDEQGHRRLNRPSDPVRVEIETAFRAGVRVIPLLLDSAGMPGADDLPGTLAELSRLNAFRVRYETFRSDVDRLVRELEEELGEVPARTPVTKDEISLQSAVRRRGFGAGRASGEVETDERQRRRLVSRLSRTYTEYLDQALAPVSTVPLRPGLEWRPDKVFRPQDRLLAGVDPGPDPLPAGASMVDVFDASGGLDGDGLLVLGDPGAGKTTLLFQLARALAARAEADPRHPLPVYLPLSTWAVRRPPLDRWLVDQLADYYQVPASLGRAWVHGGELLFLLDGLDEIADFDDRTACIEAVNRFNRFGRTNRMPMVVASRSVEYDAQRVQLQLEATIAVRPLDPSKVLDHLRAAGPNLTAAVTLLEGDPELLQLMRSPLWVSMLTVAYSGLAQSEIRTAADTAERRNRLINAYVNRRFKLDARTSNLAPGSQDGHLREHAETWLAALADNLTARQQTVLLLARLAPDWLPSRWSRLLVTAAPGLLVAIGGVAVAAVMWGILSYTLLTLGIPAALGLGLGLGLVGRSPPEERLSWSWDRALRQFRRAVVTGTSVELSTAVLTYMAYRGQTGQSDPSFRYVLLGSAPFAVLIGLSTLVVWQMRNLEPGLGIGLWIGLCVGCATGIAHVLLAEPFRDALLSALLAGVAAGVCAGLVGPLKPAERLSWSWRRARSRWRIPLVVIVVAEATIGTQWGSEGELATGVVIGLLVGVAAWLAGGMTARSVPLYVTPNEGIRRSVRNGVSAGAITALTTGGLTVLTEGGLANGAIVGLSSGSLAGIAYGLGAGIQHGLLRLLLFRYDLAPLRYVRWLDSMVRLRLLYRGVSGGYVFIHGMVQEYFASTVPVRAADVSRP